MKYHTLSPKYSNLKKELISNKMCAISIQEFNEQIVCSKLVIDKESTHVASLWRACKTSKQYGIIKHDKIYIENILCIHLYCNISKLCKNFRKSYRHMKNGDNEEIIRTRHINNFYWFGRFLMSSVAFWGKIARVKHNFYHGLQFLYLFSSFSAVFEIPTSTTDDVTSTQKFINFGKGMTLKLSPKYKTANSHYLNVSRLSNYPDEREYLIAGESIMAIVNIYTPSFNKWEGHEYCIKAILYFERIIEQDNHTKNDYNYG
eukprot:525990_1